MENLQWEVEFDWEAEKMGLITVSIQFEVSNPASPTGVGTTGFISVQCQVFKGWTPEQKAACIVSRLRAGLGNVLDIEYQAGNDDFKMKVKNNPGAPVPNAQAIAGFSKVDGGTGEGITGVKDAPGKEIPLLTGYLYVSGKGTTKKGIAQLQLGADNPLVEVPTFEKTGEQIIKALISDFNKAYARLGFVAEPNYKGPVVALVDEPCLSVPKTPCPLGIRAGSRDPGLYTETGLVLV